MTSPPAKGAAIEDSAASAGTASAAPASAPPAASSADAAGEAPGDIPLRGAQVVEDLDGFAPRAMPARVATATTATATPATSASTASATPCTARQRRQPRHPDAMRLQLRARHRLGQPGGQGGGVDRGVHQPQLDHGGQRQGRHLAQPGAQQFPHAGGADGLGGLHLRHGAQHGQGLVHLRRLLRRQLHRHGGGGAGLPAVLQRLRPRLPARASAASSAIAATSPGSNRSDSARRRPSGSRA
jgi:hypothetical protein